MKKVSALVVLVMLGLPGLRAEPIPLYENWGNVTFGDTAPQIDALAFANYGSFNVSVGLLPYDFQNTRYFTNRGTMNGLPGFRFDTVFPSGERVSAINFENQGGGIISAGPWLSVNADRIVNQGLLSANASGMIYLRGNHVDIRRSGLEIRPPTPSLFTFVTPSNFWPDTGIFDAYWGGLVEDEYDSGSFLQMLPGGNYAVSSPMHIVTNAGGFLGFESIRLENPLSAILTNQVSPTNYVVQAAFVGLPDDLHNANMLFGLPGETGLRPIFVQLSLSDTNVVTEDIFDYRLYFVDRLASSTNDLMALNLDTETTYRPAIYELSRSAPFGFGFASPPNTPFDDELFNNPEFEDGPVTNYWAAYGALIRTQETDTADYPLASITNSAGRVQIEGDAVDLSRARIRANGVVSIDAKHLIGSEDTVLDSPHLYYRLASTNGTLRIQNLAKDYVIRQSGSIRAWSALWTNISFEVEITPPDDPEGDPTETTNTVQHVFHALLLDASDLNALQPVTVHQLAATATNIIVNDNMTVIDRFSMNGQHVTLDSDLLLTGVNRDWTWSNAPTVLNFTNLGSLSFAGIGNFGNDRPNPYRAFVNRGTLNGSTHVIHGEYVENTGSITAGSRITFDAQTAKFENGEHDAGRDVIIRGRDVKFHQYIGLTGDRLFLDVSDSLADSGGGANNVLTTGDGFHLMRKPARGDLLGTELQTAAPRFARVDHIWSASDRGAVPEGFLNNVAIGRLALSAGRNAMLGFRGPDTAQEYAIYADFLDLQGDVESAFNRGDLASAIDVAPNLTIYYAYANVPVEELDGQLDGRFRWVKDFAGPNSSVDVALRSGKTIRVNRGLRESLIIDSNGNGLPNGLDPEPFDEPKLDVEITQIEPLVTRIQWTAAPLTTYVLEYAADFAAGEWHVLDTVTNPSDARQLVVVEDHGVDAQSHRYYRVRYRP